jgi:integrase
MPAIASKADCLKGVVFCYATDTTKWYYREYNETTQKYQYKLIKNAHTVAEAKEKAIEVFTIFRQREVNGASTVALSGGVATHTVLTQRRSDTPNSRIIDPLIDAYLKKELSRVEAGIIKHSTYSTRAIAIGIHLREYLKKCYIHRTHQITLTTFDDWHVYRHKCTKLTRNKEVVDVRHFLSFLIRNEYLHPKLSKVNDLIKRERVFDEDLQSNPAICPEDWKLITKALRDYIAIGAKHTNPKTHYWRTLFHCFCLCMKNSGLRPVELRHLRWCDVEFHKLTPEEDELRRSGKMSSALTNKAASVVMLVKKSKTHSQREVPAKCGRELRRWKDYLDGFIATHRSKSAVKIDLTPNSYIFGNCDNEFKPYIECFFTEAWQEAVRRPLAGKLKGHRMSDKEYSMYSMRSSFIEDNLLQDGGCDIFYLARVAGHDVKILQKHYERINVRARSNELRQLPFGKKVDPTVDTGSLF